MLAHLYILKYSRYQILINFFNSTLAEQEHKSIIYKVAYIDEDFTQMHLAIRYSFMCFSLLITISFLLKVCRFYNYLSLTYD